MKVYILLLIIGLGAYFCAIMPIRNYLYHVFKEGILNFVRSHNPLTKSMIPVESLFDKYLTMKIKDNTK